MRFTLAIVSLFFYQLFYGQELTAFKTQDTFYIVLKELPKGGTIAYKGFTLQNASNKARKAFILKDSIGYDRKIYISAEGFKEVKITGRKSKVFLKSNRHRIINYKLLERYGLFEVFARDTKKRVYYILNEKDLKRRKIRLLQVLVVPLGYVDI